MASISKAQVKFIRSLQQKKVRDEYGFFVAEGEKCVGELLKTFRAEMIIGSVATDLPITHTATATEMEQMSSLRTPQGIIAVFHRDGALFSGKQTEGADAIVALDGIQDPGNLGTIIRTCDWFGVRQIVCSPDTADCFNSKVVQATMGALARVKVHYTPLVEWLQQQECPIYGTLLEGKNMYEMLGEKAKGEKAIIVMGNEGNGISAEVRKCVTHAIRIPSYPPEAETSESLNVAIATGIVLAEFRRKETD